MSITVRGVVIILAIGLALLVIAALADRRTRLRLERQRPPDAPDDGRPPPDYLTDDQLAARFRPQASGPEDERWVQLRRTGPPLDLGLAEAGLATLAGGRGALDQPAAVLVCREPVETTREILGPLGRTGPAGLIIAAPAFEAEVRATLVANVRAGTVRLLALTGGAEALAHLAELTGAAVVSRADRQADDVPPEALGHVSRALADARHTWVETE